MKKVVYCSTNTGKLAQVFGVQGIPMLVVLDGNGKIVDVGIAAAGGTRESSRQLPGLLDRLLKKEDN